MMTMGLPSALTAPHGVTAPRNHAVSTVAAVLPARRVAASKLGGRQLKGAALTPLRGRATHGGQKGKASANANVTYASADAAPAQRSGGKPRICILGGGFGGLYTALRLNSLPWPAETKPEIVMIDQSDKFVFKPLLYELLNGGVTPGEVAPSFSELLASTDVTFKQASVDSIQPLADGSASGCVSLAGGDTLEYDWLVLALGAQTKVGMIPGVKEHAFPFATLEDAQAVDARLYALEAELKAAPPPQSPVRVAVVGGGPSGVELAATVAERLGNMGEVQLLTSGDDILVDNPAGQRADARKVLSGQRVEILTGCRVAQVHGMSDKDDKDKTQEEPKEEGGAERIIELDDGRMIEAEMVLWTAGQAPVVPKSEAVGAYGLPLAAKGEAVTDSFLRVRSHPQMFALGDAAFVTDATGAKLPATAQVAFQAADYVGWNVWASINSRPLLPFKYQHLGDMMALGVASASVAFPFDFTLDGLPASVLRKAAYVYRQPTLDQAVKVGMGMVSRPLFDIVEAIGGKPKEGTK